MSPLFRSVFLLALTACAVRGGTGLDATGDPTDDRIDDPLAVDLTDVVLTLRSADCADYVDSYYALATDLERDLVFDAAFDIEHDGDVCTFTSNSIPNHDFNDRGSFATPVAEVDLAYDVPADPVAASSPTPLSLAYDNAVFLNGVKLDVLAAACYGVGPDRLGQEKIGCHEQDQPWRYDPMHPGNRFGTDAHNAHTQPDGSYHYHGSPNALFEHANPSTESPVIGFAADGFPIFGPYIEEGGRIRKVVSGYTLKAGQRVSQAGEGAYPGGTYDGTFVDDYTFTGAGDLDECNGMSRDGVYGYYVTDTYPWVIGCFTGTPDDSFRKRR